MWQTVSSEPLTLHVLAVVMHSFMLSAAQGRAGLGSVKQGLGQRHAAAVATSLVGTQVGRVVASDQVPIGSFGHVLRGMAGWL